LGPLRQKDLRKFFQSIKEETARREILITSYAYAVAESSASGEEVVTAPTCGSSGVLPAILYYCYHDQHVPFETVKDALYSAGIFGNLVKQNASIAGAIGGCQAEIGTASSMAAAALCAMEGLSLYQIEYAAECAMEHFLGLSCDPVDGYVIIPCIERNGMGALRAYDAYLYAKYIAPLRKNQVSFDDVVEAMKLTGDSLASAYKETAEGGLAEILKKKKVS
jgi:L-serine dehydratase